MALDKLNTITDFNPIDRTVRCGPGAVTQLLQEYAADKGLFYPVDFASSGSSQIGGNISTNAGGIKVIRYGMTRDWVAGLKVVTGTGELLDLNRGLIKNASGYDLRHLFIGSEGTLGLIVEATLRLVDPPLPSKVMLIGIESMDALMKVFGLLRAGLELSAFEFFTDRALHHVCNANGLAAPFETSCPLYVVTEFDCQDTRAEDKALASFEACSKKGWVMDGVISQSERQVSDLWRYREGISESISHFPPYKNDL